MKQVKMALIVICGLVLFMFGGHVNGANERTSISGDAGKKVRSKEDVVNNPEMFIADIPGNDKARMSSRTVNDKRKKDAGSDLLTVQVLQNDLNKIGKYKESPPGAGDKK